MRSARTVSSVIKITLGWSVAAAASAGNSTRRPRIEARRLEEKGVSILADSLFGTKAWKRRSENDLCSDLRSARVALRKERVAGGDIRRLRVSGEVRVRAVGGNLARRDRGAARDRIEVSMVQQVEDLKADLEAHPFRDLGGLVKVKIPLPESGAAESVAAAGPDGVGSRNGKYRLPIRNGGAVGVTELVNRFHARTVRPLVD